MKSEVKNYLEEDHRSYRRNVTKDRSAAPVSERLRVRILFKPDFFFQASFSQLQKLRI